MVARVKLERDTSEKAAAYFKRNLFAVRLDRQEQDVADHAGLIRLGRERQRVLRSTAQTSPRRPDDTRESRKASMVAEVKQKTPNSATPLQAICQRILGT